MRTVPWRRSYDVPHVLVPDDLAHAGGGGQPEQLSVIVLLEAGQNSFSTILTNVDLIGSSRKLEGTEEKIKTCQPIRQ